MAQAKQGDTVKVHYTGKLATDETVFDSSEDREPLEFTIGSGQIIPGFENAIVGMEPGEEKTADVTSDDGYGPYRDDMILQVTRDQFPPDVDPAVGQQYQLRQPDGNALIATVTAVDGDQITLDANHPLAGQDLTFDIQLLEIV